MKVYIKVGRVYKEGEEGDCRQVHERAFAALRMTGWGDTHVPSREVVMIGASPITTIRGVD